MSSEGQKDVVIIGAGPGGYVAAIRAAQLGARVAIIDRKHLGGTCLNVGCIPTKVLLHTVELFNAVKEGKGIGLMADNVRVDWSLLMKRKETVVSQLVGGVRSLLSSNGVEIMEGEASFVNEKEVLVKSATGESHVKADHFIIATGSEPILPPIPGIHTEGVITSNEALSLEKIPSSMTIIGGGVIGVEFASIFSSLGCNVTIVEMLSEILPNTDEEITGILKKLLQVKGVKFYTSSKVTSLSRGKTGVMTSIETASGTMELDSEKVLLSVGRKPVTEGLGLERIGMKMNRSRVMVNSEMKTSIDHIYAIGDCCSPVMLAHVASREGEVAAENILGHKARMDYKTTPGAVYTSPEIAWVGMTEKEAREKGHHVRIGRFPLVANGKSLIMGETEGMIKFVVDGKYDEILGVHIIGPRATDLIVEGALALRLEATVEEIISTIHAHPTVGEALGEAALDVLGRALHIPPRKK
ncbi:MAG: dihydrolipoyl dehydrogenase [Synergistales bacterium]|nr:dihydrolipoyl dehydrogenase [Synergistales bacterium]